MINLLFKYFLIHHHYLLHQIHSFIQQLVNQHHLDQFENLISLVNLLFIIIPHSLHQINTK